MTDSKLEKVAGNGLLNRRHLLGLGLAGAGSIASSALLGADSALKLEIPAWSQQPGPGTSGYGSRSRFTEDMQRATGNSNPLYPGGGASRSPLQLLQGTITPNSLHFERHHSGIPDIDPAQHKLVINGLVKQPLVFSYEDLLKYPMVSKIYFLECSGNSGSGYGANAVNGTAQSLHGLVSCAEWTGVLLSTLLDEAGVEPEAQWVSAVGADAASMGRSVPLNKAMDDVLIALFQNGEPVRPAQGYPMRLFVPGWEGNISVKWLTQLKLTREASQFRDETSKYTDTLPNRKSLQFTFPMGTKSLITSPSGQMSLNRQGIYQVTGIAWSGSGSIRRVEVSADGGRSWADAMIESHQSDKALARFRIPWEWSGGDAILQSRATDSQGNVQPTRNTLIDERGSINFYHFHGIQSWAINTAGEVSNVFA
ncbi:MAG: sulfite dehydrogenase [SAR86 cluster bacterium]|uniref:Sulfite dehydrogenase n=1 Tax=SAR86 cluster bacterium TaxID=2030880 RepID=A0A2A5AW09_9GAMM|nr:MAG: sulfite dehydrogenase [SAR86 cluster bacterium]